MSSGEAVALMMAEPTGAGTLRTSGITPKLGVEQQSAVVTTPSPTRRRRLVVSSRSMPSSKGGPKIAAASSVSQTNEALAQSQRLLRVLLGASGAESAGGVYPINKYSVDQALEKYLRLLRQVQASGNPQQQLVIAQQQRQQIVELEQQIHQLEGALERQKSAHGTTLEIKAVELEICTRERDQKQLQVQQLQWKLAKCRAEARDRLANHAAAVAASSSLVNRAEIAEQAVSEQQTQIQTLVAALRNKDRVLKQLLEIRPCTLCRPAVEECQLEEEHNNKQKTAEQDSEKESFSTMNSMHSAASSKTAVVGHLSSSILNYEFDGDDEDDDDLELDESSTTPLTSVVVEQLETSTATAAVTVMQEPAVLISDAAAEAQQNDGTANGTITGLLQQRVETMSTQLRQAKQALAKLEEEKARMEEDLEETIEERNERLKHLMGVLIACNERRKAAEQILQEHQLHDEESLAIITQQHPERLIHQIVSTEIEARIERSEPVSVEVQRLKRALTETEQQLRETEQELAQLESVGRGAVDKILALEEAVANLEASKTTQQHEYAGELQKMRETLVDAEVTIEILKQCLESKSLEQKVKPSVTANEITSSVVEIAPTHREEATEPFSTYDFFRDEQKTIPAGIVVANETKNSAQSKNVILNYLEPLQMSDGFAKEHEFEAKRRQVEEMGKRITQLEANLAVANGKLVFLREMILSVAPAERTTIVDEK